MESSLGAVKQMQTIIIDECTGCDLCVDPCPVDCIGMIPVEVDSRNWEWKFNKVPVGNIPVRQVS